MPTYVPKESRVVRTTTVREKQFQFLFEDAEKETTDLKFFLTFISTEMDNNSKNSLLRFQCPEFQQTYNFEGQELTKEEIADRIEADVDYVVRHKFESELLSLASMNDRNMYDSWLEGEIQDIVQTIMCFITGFEMNKG